LSAGGRGSEKEGGRRGSRERKGVRGIVVGEGGFGGGMDLVGGSCGLLIVFTRLDVFGK